MTMEVSGGRVRKVLENFPNQFSFSPNIENLKDDLYDSFIVIGMGGSHLAADIIKMYNNVMPLHIHSDYGLPYQLINCEGETLIIGMSYSGNTEETLDVINEAIKSKCNVAAISSGGKLLELARENELPYIQLPAGIQPRHALGYTTKALLTLLKEFYVGDQQESLFKSLSEVNELPSLLDTQECEIIGGNLKEKITRLTSMPHIYVYSSRKNLPLAYIWKINFNETSKMPASYHYFPELNHNEIEGFWNGSELPFFVFLKDESDDDRIKKRMEILKEIFSERSYIVEELLLEEKDGNMFYKIFNSVLISYWTSFHLALHNKVDPERVDTIEVFKKKMRE